MTPARLASWTPCMAVASKSTHTPRGATGVTVVPASIRCRGHPYLFRWAAVTCSQVFMATGAGTHSSDPPQVPNQPPLARKGNMPFSDLEHARLRKTLTAWAEEVPVHARDQIRHGFRIGANDVVIFETRPHFQPPHEWVELEVAKFRYVRAAKEWRLYCRFRDLRWCAYEPFPSARSFEELFAEVRRDPTNIFWG